MKALSIVLAVVAACLLALIAVFWFGGALEAEIAIAPAIAGEEALAAVEDVQNGLAVDGIVGPATAKAAKGCPSFLHSKAPAVALGSTASALDRVAISASMPSQAVRSAPSAPR